MNVNKPIVVGFDFDGVIAYNPARLARYPISLFKKRVLGIEKVSFFVPKNDFERTIWALAHETSMFPAVGTTHLKRLVRSGKIEAHLVTSRFGFLEHNLKRFLSRWGLTDSFKTVTLNYREEQPHEFKERQIREKKFAFYVEDNWDIISYLAKKKVPATVHWIYNVFDRNQPYPHKYPYLEKSLQDIVRP